MLGEKMFLNILLFTVASTYWYMTGHMVPALLGYVFMLIFLYSDELYFVSLVFGIITLLSIVFFSFFTDEASASQVGLSVLYIIVIFFQSKSIFDAD